MNKGMGQRPPLLILEDIWKNFLDTGTVVRVLAGVHLELHEGDFLAITGASGVGKSTLLHIMGLLDRPSKGRVKFDGRDITTLSDRKLSEIRNRELGFIFQFHHLLPDFTASENILMPKRISGSWSERDFRRAAELSDLVGVSHRMEHLPSQLSGGERQRVAVARALMNSPRLLLCDEPSGNLDSGNSRNLHDLLRRLNRELGVTVVIVTHDEHLAAMASRQFLLEEGGLMSLAHESASPPGE